jgi:hypothetical protein
MLSKKKEATSKRSNPWVENTVRCRPWQDSCVTLSSYPGQPLLLLVIQLCICCSLLVPLTYLGDLRLRLSFSQKISNELHRFISQNIVQYKQMLFLSLHFNIIFVSLECTCILQRRIHHLFTPVLKVFNSVNTQVRTAENVPPTSGNVTGWCPCNCR